MQSRLGSHTYSWGLLYVLRITKILQNLFDLHYKLCILTENSITFIWSVKYGNLSCYIKGASCYTFKITA